MEIRPSNRLLLALERRCLDLEKKCEAVRTQLEHITIGLGELQQRNVGMRHPGILMTVFDGVRRVIP
jgi:hypothetical protein